MCVLVPVCAHVHDLPLWRWLNLGNGSTYALILNGAGHPSCVIYYWFRWWCSIQGFVGLWSLFQLSLSPGSKDLLAIFLSNS